MPANFVHLHCHSDSSLLDGGSPSSRLIQRAVELEMPAMALTDHGVLYGAWEFYEQAKKQGVNPIIGMEAYVAPGHRSDTTLRTARGRFNYHLVLLARDIEGYRNLIKLSSIGFKEGFYYNPRLDREVLAKYNQGLIVTSACLAGEVAQHLERGDEEAAIETASWYANVFQDRYYLEVQAHDTEGQAALNDSIFRIAEKLGLPVIASNDVHFLTDRDHGAHDTLICIGLGKDRNDQSRLYYDKNLYFKTAAEMGERFPSHPEVLENTLAIAESCHLVFDKRYYVPNFPVDEAQRVELLAKISERKARGEESFTAGGDGEELDAAAREQRAVEDQLLRDLAYAGARRRYGEDLPSEVVERLEYELGVITRCGYSGYHLIVQDFINWAKENDIPVGPGRGSAAGSLVCYCLGITDVDPLSFDLLFERFLNPDRVSMPDIDVDFCYERRGEVIEYVKERYGHDSVGQIVTFGTMRARAAVRDVGRVLGFKPFETDKIAKLIPNQPGFSLTVAEAIEKVPDVEELYKTDARARELLDLASRLEGLRRHASIHAAGVVIAPGPLDEYVPVAVQWGKDGREGGEGQVVTQYDMNCLERAGMLKMDFLGLKTLTVIHDAISMAEARRPGLRIDFNEIPTGDPQTYRMLQEGRTAGVFQLESPLATEKLVAMRVDSFDDLVALNALLRPGPLDTGMTDRYIRRKRNEESVDYPHPLLEEVLKPTLGIITYQEQIMRAAQLLGGYTLAEADVLRKAVGTKNEELIKSELKRFVERSTEAGTCTRTQADEIAALIQTFGRYGFNRSHSVAYSVLGFRTAYLKAHYPAEFMAALLSSVSDKPEELVYYLAEVRELGVKVLRPDVQESQRKFSVVGDSEKGDIRFGLSAIKGVGDAVVSAILRERENGKFLDFFDFVQRVYASGAPINRRVLEALIQAGALDSLGGNRAQMLAAADKALRESAVVKREQETGQFGLFGGAEFEGSTAHGLQLPDIPEMRPDELLAREKAVIGLYVSGHPLEEVAEIAKTLSTCNLAQLREVKPGTRIRVAGVVGQLESEISKRTGKPWGKFVLEDLTGTTQVLVFNEAWTRFEYQLKDGAVILVDGRIKEDERDDNRVVSLLLERVQPLMEAALAGDLAVQIQLDPRVEENAASMSRLRDLLDEFSGNAPVYLRQGESLREARARVRPLPEFVERLREIVGDEMIKLVRVAEEPSSANRGWRRNSRWSGQPIPVGT